MTITEEQLAEWGRLASEATEGPWEVAPEDGGCHRVRVPTPETGGRLLGTLAELDDWRDADFIAAARGAVPALVAEVRRLRHGLGALTKAYAKAGNDTDDMLIAQERLGIASMLLMLNAGADVVPHDEETKP